MKRTPEELLELTEEFSKRYPYTKENIFNYLVSLVNFNWRSLSDDKLRELLEQRMARGY
ncbi:hypothetical protein P7D79_10750 [Enterococcus avium]|uniref:Uncharacterized protein n=1 Tax=Enterococcus avium TaxID=33945 RepID=A0ABD5F866_ENTAV|nr:hypothetical protein [Enterococcus avium]MDT2514692.1 hypothetical protein [Enterococcus avium]